MKKQAEGKLVDEQPKKRDELAFSGTRTIAKDVPEYLHEHIGSHEGQEGVGQDDILIPRLGIAQAGKSPQMNKASEQFIPGLEDGEFFNTVTNERYGFKVLVVPLLFYKNYIAFKSMDDGGGVLGMYASKSEVPVGGLDWVDGKKPAVTEFKNRLCLIITADKTPELIAVSFKSTGLKAAKKWNSLINATNLPAFARSYDLESKNRTEGNKSWYVADVEPNRFVPEAFFAQAKSYFDNLQEGGFKVDVSGLDVDETETAAEGNAVPF